MDGKRELLEDVYGFVPQRLRDMAKAGLPESQSPAVEPHTPRYHVYNPMPSACLESSFFQTTLWPMGDAQ
jgi:hypothetical protein